MKTMRNKIRSNIEVVVRVIGITKGGRKLGSSVSMRLSSILIRMKRKRKKR